MFFEAEEEYSFKLTIEIAMKIYDESINNKHIHIIKYFPVPRRTHILLKIVIKNDC